MLRVFCIGLPCNLFLSIKYFNTLGKLSNPSIVSIVFMYLADSDPLTLSVPISIIANLVSLAYGNSYQMGRIFIWAVWQALVLYSPIVLFMVPWHFGLKAHAFSAWLATFEEDWIEKDRFALWRRLVKYEVWIDRHIISWYKIGKKIDLMAENFRMTKSIRSALPNWASRWKEDQTDIEMMVRLEQENIKKDDDRDDAVVAKLLAALEDAS